MKKLFLMASFGALLAAAPALAADDHHDAHPGGTPPAHADHGGGHGDVHAGGPGGHVAAAPAHVAPPNHMTAPTGPMSGPVAPTNHGSMVAHHDHAQSGANNAAVVHGNAAMHGNAMHGNAMQAGHAGNFASLHRNITASHHYHAGTYRRPHGWYAHRWTYGQILPTAFFVQSYWIDNFYDYGLMAPPPGTVWVRYGDDALLIDEDTGEVIQVVYGVFY